MNERLIHLRIKVRSLADEARSIREEAKKTTGMVKWGLNDHRKTIVRDHARHNLLAYGCLKNTPYSDMEKWCYETPDFLRVAKIAKRFGGAEEDVESWVSAAKMCVKNSKELRINPVAIRPGERDSVGAAV